MKVYPTSLYCGYNYPNFSLDGYSLCLWRDSLLKYGDIEFSKLESSDVVFLFIFGGHLDLIFDKAAASKIEFLQKPIVIIEFTEYGGWGSEKRLFEHNIYGYEIEYKNALQKDYKLLHEFLLKNQHLIKAYFKRELNHKDISKIPFKVFPIEFIHDTYTNINPVQTQEEFLKRQIRYNFIWSYSHPSRANLQGAILSHMEKFQCTFASTFKQCDDLLEKNEHFLLLNKIEEYEKVNKDKLLEYQFRSRAVIDIYGCGKKCYRNIESTNNCVSIKQDPNIVKYTYPWIDKENCIILPNVPGTSNIDRDLAVEILLYYQHYHQHLLYPIYLKSLEMNKLYSPLNYVPNHIMKNIKECL